jgi:uncharacterized protein (TIGR03083 family)
MINATSIVPITRAEAPALATAEFERLLDQLRSLSLDDWDKPTDCEGWDVRAMVAHNVGMAEAQASPFEFARQQRIARREAGDRPVIDAMTAVQVRERAEREPEQLIAELSRVAPRAVRTRRRVPAPLRALRMKVDPPFDSERWKLGYLMDVIFTRDTWMHRIDIARATGRELTLSPEHDGRIVADVVGEWFRRHGRPCTLTLTGPAGGTFVSAAHVGTGDGVTIEIDAIELCRIVSGREVGTGLLTTLVPF